MRKMNSDWNGSALRENPSVEGAVQKGEEGRKKRVGGGVTSEFKENKAMNLNVRGH